ncbi:MAG: hypothetical protein AB7O60_20010, partial [Variibacter sp.]
MAALPHPGEMATPTLRNCNMTAFLPVPQGFSPSIHCGEKGKPSIVILGLRLWGAFYMGLGAGGWRLPFESCRRHAHLMSRTILISGVSVLTLSIGLGP